MMEFPSELLELCRCARAVIVGLNVVDLVCASCFAAGDDDAIGRLDRDVPRQVGEVKRHRRTERADLVAVLRVA